MTNQERTVTFGTIAPSSSVFGTDSQTQQQEQWIEPSLGIPQGNRIRRAILFADKSASGSTAAALIGDDGGIQKPDVIKLHLMRDGKSVTEIDATWLRGSLVGPSWPPLPMNVGVGKIQWSAENKLKPSATPANDTFAGVSVLFDWLNPLQTVVLS